MMKSAGPSRTAILVPGIVCLAFAVAMAVQLSRSMREDFYWTPSELAPPLSEVDDRVEVLLDGEPIDQVLAGGGLQRADGSAPDTDDFAIRFNDADRIETRQVVLLTASFTAGLVLLVMGLLPGRRPVLRRSRDETMTSDSELEPEAEESP
jgi:hypothetical protein